MTCQSTGREPIVTMGFGTSSEYPRSLIPAPPQNSTTFILATSVTNSANRNFRDGDYEVAAPFPNVLQLFHNFIFEIPGKNDHVIRFCLANPVRMIDRDMSTGQESALLVRTAIHRVLDQILANTAIMQERCTFSRSSVSRNRLALSRCLEKKFDESELCFASLFREASITGRRIESGSFFHFN